MAFLIILLKYIVGLHNVSLLELATGTLIFSLLDVTVSYPNKNQEIDREDARKILQVMGGTKKEVINADRVNKITIYPDILKEINKYSVDRELVGFFQNHLPLEIDGSRNIQIVDDLTSESENMVAAHSLDMLFCTTSMNDVKRLNLFLEQVVNRLAQCEKSIVFLFIVLHIFFTSSGLGHFVKFHFWIKPIFQEYLNGWIRHIYL